MEAIELKIPVNLSDQEKIADYLQKIDQEIELNNQINDNLLAKNIYLIMYLLLFAILYFQILFVECLLRLG